MYRSKILNRIKVYYFLKFVAHELNSGMVLLTGREKIDVAVDWKLLTYFNIYIYNDYYRITTVNCTYQKLSASESTSATRALSRSHFSWFLMTHFDFRSENSTRRPVA
jgi:hypothetical protein